MGDWIINYKENNQVWDAFVSTSPQRSIFVCSKFLDSLKSDYDLVTCYEKDKIVAGAVLIYSNVGEPINSVYPFTQYQGMILAGNSQMEAHSKVTHELKVVGYFLTQLTARYSRLCFCHSWRLGDLRPFQWHNYHEPHKGQFKIDLGYTGILDLHKYENFEDYLSSVRSVRRQEFKKSSQVLKLQYSDDVLLLDALHAKTFERQSLGRNDQESMLIRSICNHAIANGYGKLSIAFLDDVAVSAVFFLYDDRTAYYMFGANDPAYRNTGAGTFLLMHMIKNAFERGVNEVDFVGVNSPNRGDFKVSFNADVTPYFVTCLMRPAVSI